jgi:uncharacterized protein (DUF302 family)
MIKLSQIALVMVFIGLPAMAADGVVNVQSPFSVEETADRLNNVLNNKGMTVFNRVKHSEAAGKVGIQLRDTELIIFGNPKAGSPLMKCQQSIAIDLPQKALVWADDQSKVWISYNDLSYLAKRHDLSGCEAAIAKVGKALAGITKAAVTE